MTRHLTLADIAPRLARAQTPTPVRRPRRVVVVETHHSSAPAGTRRRPS